MQRMQCKDSCNVCNVLRDKFHLSLATSCVACIKLEHVLFLCFGPFVMETRLYLYTRFIYTGTNVFNPATVGTSDSVLVLMLCYHLCANFAVWSRHCVTLTFAELFRLAVLLSGNSRWVLINAFFQVKFKLPLSKLLSTLKVIIDFANHFRSAEYALFTNLIWAKPINDQPPQCI